MLNQPLPNTPLRWTTDPANFEGFPEFFLAHEVAHQWWAHQVIGGDSQGARSALPLHNYAVGPYTRRQ